MYPRLQWKEDLTVMTEDYRNEDRKVGEVRDDIGAIRYRSWLARLKPQIITPKRTNRSSAKKSIWKYRLKAEVWNGQILNNVVESQLFTSSWNS